MKYLHWFETEGKYEEKRYGDYIEPWTSFVMESERVDYNMDDEEKLLCTPLTFEMMGNGSIWWTTQGDDVTRTIEYRKNGGEWISITSSTVETETSTINVVSGDTVEFRGNNSNYGNGYTAGGHQRRGNFRTAVPFKAYGNVMSLVNSSRFMTIKAIDGSNTSMFSYLFSNCSGLTDISQLLLPVTEMKIGGSVASMCYYSMFENCFNLTGAPTDLLPATVLSNQCYQQMFLGCSSLAVAPELPAVVLPDSTYRYMFDSCSNLTTAPVLPATGTVSTQYYRMFYGCSKLNYIKCLANSIGSNSQWCIGVQTVSGTFVKNPDVTVEQWGRGSDGIPTGWTVEDAN